MCKYCEIPVSYFQDSENSFFISEKVLYFENYLDGEYIKGGVEINFCPICGQKLD